MGKLSVVLATILVVLSLQSAKGSELTFKFGNHHTILQLKT
jgi:hypothetical protein